MLEPCVNQAAGLQRLGLQQAPRLVAVVSHGQQQGELPLLWGLCASWVALDLSVLVLDGHVTETSAKPGLTQLLNNPTRRLIADEEPLYWSVLPAAEGLSNLKNQNNRFNQVGEIFKNYSIILIYTGASTLSELLKGSTLAPVLVVPPALLSAVTAYQALKQLLLNGQLRPTVANIVPEHNPMMSITTSTTAQHVMDCAATFLGYSTKPFSITACAKADRSQQDIDRLALQMFENALLLERPSIERVH